MSKLTITEAVAVLPVSESTLRRDMKSGKVSFETDAKGRNRLDVAELTRAYGVIPSENENDRHMTPRDTRGRYGLPHGKQNKPQSPSRQNTTERIPSR